MATRTQIATGTPAVPTLWRCGGRSCGAGECEHEENELHRHASGPAPQDVPGIVHDVLGSSGTPLPEDARRDMQRRLGHDFAAVRIHTDAQAAEAADAVRARAFTVGQRVAFGRGQFDPTSSTGREVLAHELVHTIQQRHQPRPASGPALAVSDPFSAAEREAESVAEAAIHSEGTAMKQTVAPQSVPVTVWRCGGRQCPPGECDHEDGELHRHASGTGPRYAPPLVHDVLHTNGSPLPDSVRTDMEHRLDHDFTDVQIHSDSRAGESALAVAARAYTVGRHVVFAPGEFSPHTSTGRRLLTHELTHAASNPVGATPPRGALRVSSPDDPAERHATQRAAEVDTRHLATHPSAGTRPASRHSPTPPGADTLMRTPLFNSTMEICHRQLRSRTFSVTEGGVRVSAVASYERRGTPACSDQPYNMTLTKENLLLDDEYGTCDFAQAVPQARVWTGLPNGDYHLTIWTNNTNPYCCLTGTIEVSQDRSLTGPSCTVPPPGPLEILHTALDLAGLIPVLGAVPDAVNAGIYVVEGDWVNAGLSAAAMVPIFGDAATVVKIGAKQVLRVSGAGVRRAGREGIEAGLREARAARRASHVPAEIDEAVERGIVEEAATTGRPRIPRPGPPPATGFGEAARRTFDGLREGYARRLGVNSGGQVHHAVELQTLDRYPGVFSPGELNDFANMRGIPNELANRRQLHNSKIRELWDRAYVDLDHQIAQRGLTPGTAGYDAYVRRYLEAQRETIDHVLGQFFSEQRRLLGL